MKKVSNATVAYIFYAVGSIDYVSANFFNNDLTGITFSPILFGGVGSVFMFLHNSKIKESNNNIYEVFKLSLYAVLISDENIDEGELEYSVSILNTLENNLLIPVNPSKLEQDILKYDTKEIYKKIENLQSSIPYKTKLNILSTCSILCVIDGQIEEVEQEAIYKISNILNISNDDMKNIFNNSIEKYIDFKNSGKKNLEINDSEVHNVIEEKKKENKSNKNQTYTGFGLAMLLIIFSIYSSFQITIEESCDRILLSYNEITPVEKNFLLYAEESKEIWNNYIEYLDDEYFQLTSEDQVLLHNSLDLYKINDLTSEQNLLIDTLLSINKRLFSEEMHSDLERTLALFNSLHNLMAGNMQLYSEKNNLQIEYIETIEVYFKEWDLASEQNNTNLIDTLEEDFNKYEDEFGKEFQETLNQLSTTANSIDRTHGIFITEFNASCDVTFTE